jgi:hypothetical protein
MIERIEWESHSDELLSPFMRGKGERPLRITLHSESLIDLSSDEKEAIQIMRELGNLVELNVFETGPSDFPQIVIGESDPKDDVIPVKLIHKGEIIKYTGVYPKNQLYITAEHLIDPQKQNKETIKEMFDTLVIALAHKKVGGDILITKSPILLSKRDQQIIKETCPYNPLEAGKLVGLFLRSRNIYTYQAGPNFQANTTQGLFYWVLARFHLPHMWRYFSACVLSQQIRGDDTLELGESILIRAVRALQARDYIGMQFFISQNDNTEDQIMYHFDYLTLVLSGALDAQAIIANRVYNAITNERYAKFHWKDFKNALNTTISKSLYTLISKTEFENLHTLLHELRNTIHGAALKTFTYYKSGKQRQTLISIPQPTDNKLLEAAKVLGGKNEWGLIEGSDIWLEPYTYSTTLVRESLKAIDEIAATTEVARLFPPGSTIPSLQTEAPNDDIFSLGKRFSLLA